VLRWLGQRAHADGLVNGGRVEHDAGAQGGGDAGDVADARERVSVEHDPFCSPRDQFSAPLCALATSPISGLSLDGCENSGYVAALEGGGKRLLQFEKHLELCDILHLLSDPSQRTLG
jgi:hypothetical protein